MLDVGRDNRIRSAKNIVDIDLDLQPPCFTGDADFLDWYERWLTEIIDGLDSAGFSISFLPGTQAQLATVLHDHRDPLQRLLTAEDLAGLIDDPDPCSRSRAKPLQAVRRP